MTVHARLAPPDLLEALRRIAGVVADHAAALDRLALDEAEPAGDDLVGIDVAAGGTPAPIEPGAGDVAFEGMAAPSGTGPHPEGAGTDLPGSGTQLAAALDELLERLGDRPDMARFVDALEEVGRRRHVPDGPAAVLRGLAEGLRNGDVLDGGRLAIGLEVASELLEELHPGAGPGSPTAVVAAAADGALSAVDQGAPLGEALLAAVDDGFVELERGPSDDPRLAARGVVDAEAAGILLVLDSLASVVTGEPLPEAPRDALPGDAAPSRPAPFVVACDIHPHRGGVEAAAWLEAALGELGELERFDHSAQPWRCELRTALPGAAVETVLEVGRPRELHIGVVAEPSRRTTG